MAKLPFVSVVVPTKNRRIFVPQLLRCYRQQDYPLDRTELLVLDDGTDPVGDLFEGAATVRYLRLDAPLPIGAKRNMLANTARGDVIVHMDDDDWYPPTRISTAVARLLESGAQIAGSTILYIYSVHDGRVVRSGPFGPHHATAATLAYTRAYLETHTFDAHAERGEEPSFLEGFRAPLVQLDPKRTMMCVAHGRNTFAKAATNTVPVPVSIRDLVGCRASLSFYRTQLPRLLDASSRDAVGRGA